jgi:hypothetical protein
VELSPASRLFRFTTPAASFHGSTVFAQNASARIRTYESAFVTYCLNEGPSDQLVRSRRDD